MITNVSLVNVFCLNQDEARDFYVGTLGFEVRTDITVVDVQPEPAHLALAELSAKGVEFVQEPADRPYGVEAVMRDNSGNWVVLVEPRPFTPDDFA